MIEVPDQDGLEEHQAPPYELVKSVEGDAIKNAIRRVPEGYWDLSEGELRRMANPTTTDHRLRLSFWREVQLAHDQNTRVKVSSIYGGVCTYQHWYTGILQRPEKLAWLLQPLQELDVMLRPLTTRIAERYAEIIEMNISDEKGRPVATLVKLLLEAMKRVEGLVSRPNPPAPPPLLSADEVDRRIKELEAELEGSGSAGAMGPDFAQAGRHETTTK